MLWGNPDQHTRRRPSWEAPGRCSGHWPTWGPCPSQVAARHRRKDVQVIPAQHTHLPHHGTVTCHRPVPSLNDPWPAESTSKIKWLFHTIVTEQEWPRYHPWGNRITNVNDTRSNKWASCSTHWEESHPDAGGGYGSGCPSNHLGSLASLFSEVFVVQTVKWD